MSWHKLSDNVGIGDFLKLAFQATYYPVGYDSVNKTFSDGQPLSVNTPEAAYMDHPVTMVTSFIGLPNRKPQDNQQSLQNIFDNFVGWQPHAENSKRRIFNNIKAFFAIVWHLITLLPRLVTNCVKLVTEFLPRALAGLSRFAVAKLAEEIASLYEALNKREEANFPVSHLAPYYVGIYILRFFSLLSSLSEVIFSVGAFIGTALTSPIHGVMSSVKNGSAAAESLARTLGWPFNLPWMQTAFAIVGGASLGLLSSAITTFAYWYLLPHALNYVTDSVVPFVLRHWPENWFGVLQSGFDFVEKIAPVLDPINEALTTLLPVLGTVATALSTTPAIMAIGASIGFAMTSVGVLISMGVFKFTGYWANYTKTPQPAPLSDSTVIAENIERVTEENRSSTMALLKRLQAQDEKVEESVAILRAEAVNPATSSSSCLDGVLSYFRSRPASSATMEVVVEERKSLTRASR